MTLSRRRFGQTVIAGGAALSAASLFPALLSPVQEKSPVVLARAGTLKRQGHDLDRAQVADYLDKALIKLTGQQTPVAAWKSLFSAREKVAIKLSCLPGKPLSSSVGLVKAVVDGLLSAGLAKSRIYIWERTGRELERAGFTSDVFDVPIRGTDGLPAGGYAETISFAGSVGTCFSRMMEMVDALVNIPVLKDHDIAGVSIGLKNFYGAIHNPNKFHGNHGDPFIAELCTHPLVKNKLRLIVCDASRIQVHNGPAYFPAYSLEYGALLVGRDPVALDYMGFQIIEEERKRLNLKSLQEEGRHPQYIWTAERLGLGRADPGRIDLIHL